MSHQPGAETPTSISQVKTNISSLYLPSVFTPSPVLTLLERKQQLVEDDGRRTAETKPPSWLQAPGVAARVLKGEDTTLSHGHFQGFGYDTGRKITISELRLCF